MQIMREAMHALDLADQFEELSNEYALIRVAFKNGTTCCEGYAGGLSSDRTRFNIDNQNTCEPHFTMIEFAKVDHFEIIERTGNGTMFHAV